MKKLLFLLIALTMLVSCSTNTDKALNTATAYVGAIPDTELIDIQCDVAHVPLFLEDSFEDEAKKGIMRLMMMGLSAGFSNDKTDEKELSEAARKQVVELQDKINGLRGKSSSAKTLLVMVTYRDKETGKATKEILLIDPHNQDRIQRKVKVTKGLKFSAVLDYYAKENNLENLKENYEELTQTVTAPIYKFVFAPTK